jgi:hypothetical protein
MKNATHPGVLSSPLMVALLRRYRYALVDFFLMIA